MKILQVKKLSSIPKYQIYNYLCSKITYRALQYITYNNSRYESSTSQSIRYARFSHDVFIFSILVSCSTSHSVREIRASRDPNADYIPQNTKVKIPKTKQDAMVKDLFMQSVRPGISLPVIEGENNTTSALVSEQVTFKNAEVISINRTNTEKATSLSDVQKLDEVVVTAKSRFTPEQDGKINVDFIVRVPKELLSPNFRVTLTPKILHNDSIVPLQNVVLKGAEFSALQKQSYADYDAYLKSIVNKTDYDSVFVDYDKVKEDIAFQQQFYYDQYHKEWSNQTDYETWKKEKDRVEALREAQKLGYDKKLYHEHIRKARIEAMKDVAKGKDTTGFFVRYMNKHLKPKDLDKGMMTVEQRNEYRVDFYKKYSEKARQWVLRDWVNGKDTIGAYDRYMKSFDKNFKTIVLDGEDLSHIPERFRELYKSGRSMDEIMNQYLSVQDSIQIAENHYKYDEIALNEMRDAMREEKRKELIIFPYEENLRIDTIVDAGRDFIYYYKQSYPASPGLKSVRIALNTSIDAIDRSRFVQPLSDTLAYVISSLSQLVDTTLVTKKTTLYRDLVNSMTVYPKYQSGRTAFNINYEDNKSEIDKIMDTYRTFRDKGKLVIDSVIVNVSTSLNGDFDKNADISMKRAEAIQSYLVKTYGEEMGDIVKAQHSGEDWSTLLRQINIRTDLMNKDAIIDTLRSAVYPDKTEETIKKLYPEDYKVIRDSIYPLLNKAVVEFNMTRPNMTDKVELKIEERPDYQKGIELLNDRKYWDALDILSNYPDYNAALCLACMGYNSKAFELLNTLPQTGNTEYLLAILAVRSKDDNKAIEHLFKACQLDPSKIDRSRLDPEIVGLVDRHNLRNRINQLVSLIDSTQSNNNEETVFSDEYVESARSSQEN